jgi:hypothetical protein
MVESCESRWKTSQSLRRRLGFDAVAEATEEAQRGIDNIIFALLLFDGGFGLLGVTPENDTIVSIENEEPELRDVGGRRIPAGGGARAAATSAASAAHTYAGVSNRSVDGDDKVGLRGVANQDVMAPTLECIANDIIREASTGVLDTDAARGHQSGVRREDRLFLCAPQRAEQKRCYGEFANQYHNIVREGS